MRHSAISLSPPFDCLQDLAPKAGSAQLAATRFAPVILENGVIRTMEPSLPTARGLAIAGEWVAGGVGTHERALASPDRVDLGGRCVLPGFTDSHVHFPTWAMAQHEVRLEDTRSLDEALARVREAVANGRRVTAVHDKDGWLGALRFWQRLEADGALTLRVWQSLPAEKADELADTGIASGFGGPRLQLGYLKVFMDGTLGSQTARML